MSVIECILPTDYETQDMNGLCISIHSWSQSDNQPIAQVSTKSNENTVMGVIQNASNPNTSDLTQSSLDYEYEKGKVVDVRVTNTDDIQAGDLLRLSHIDGVLCKQEDKTTHSWTVAKALQDCTFLMNTDPFLYLNSGGDQLSISSYWNYSIQEFSSVTHSSINSGATNTNLIRITLNSQFEFDIYGVTSNLIQESDTSIDIPPFTYAECVNQSVYIRSSTDLFYINDVQFDGSFDSSNFSNGGLDKECSLKSVQSSDFGEYKMRISKLKAILV